MADGEIDLTAPSLMRVEAANALLTYQRRGMLDEETCIECIDRLDELPMRYADSDFPQIKEAYKLAAERDIAIYDALYASLANQTDATLITADRKIYNKLKDRGNIQLLTLDDSND